MPDVQKSNQFKKRALDHITSHSSNSQWGGTERPGPVAEIYCPGEPPTMMETCHVSQLCWYQKKKKKRQKTTDLWEVRNWVKMGGLTFLCDGFSCL